MKRLSACVRAIRVRPGELLLLILILVLFLASSLEAQQLKSKKRMAPQVGLEPTTLRLTAGCSAIELLRSVVCFSPGGRAAVKLSSFYSTAARTEESWMGLESDRAWFLFAQLLLPIEDSRPTGGRFGFRDQPFFMQRDRQGSERKWVLGFELREPLAHGDRFVEAVRLLQGACESVQGL